jgi:adenylate cyclase
MGVKCLILSTSLDGVDFMTPATSQTMVLETLAGEAELLVGFFDLAGFARWCEGRAPVQILDLMTVLFARSGRAINTSGGRLVKAMGDTGFFVHPSADPAWVVLAMVGFKRDTDAWLKESGYPGRMTVKMNLGPVSLGPVGAPGEERFDVYGETVNRAALLRGRGVVIVADLHARLSDGVKEMFTERWDAGTFVLKSADLDPADSH